MQLKRIRSGFWSLSLYIATGREQLASRSGIRTRGMWMVQCCFLVQRSKARSLASRWAGSKKVNLPEGVSQGGSVVYKYF